MDSQVQILIQSFDGKTIIKFVDNKITVNDLITQIKYNSKNTYITFNGKILNKNKCFLEQGIKDNDIVFLNSRIKGGVFPIIIAAMLAAAAFMVTLLILLEDLIVIFLKIIEIIPLIFQPQKFVNDLIFGISFGLKSIMSGMFSSIDSGSTPNKPADDPATIPKVCMSPSLFNLIFLIICPPLALFMDRGIQGMFLVIVCAILTVKLYYFPGLIFAALHIFC